MWLWKGSSDFCISNSKEEVYGQTDTRHDWECKYAQGVDVVLTVYAQSCIHPPKQSTAWGSCNANITLVTHVLWCLQALFSCYINLHVGRGFHTNLFTWIMVIRKLKINYLVLLLQTSGNKKICIFWGGFGGLWRTSSPQDTIFFLLWVLYLLIQVISVWFSNASNFPLSTDFNQSTPTICLHTKGEEFTQAWLIRKRCCCWVFQM